MGYQDDYVMRTITDLVRAIARLALGKEDISYELSQNPEDDRGPEALYRRITAMAEAGDINGAENCLYEELDTDDTGYLEMGLAFYMFINQFSDEFLYGASYSREEVVDGFNSLSAQFGISGFESFVDTTIL